MFPVKRNLTPTSSSFFDDDWNTLFNWPKGQILRSTPFPAINIEEVDDKFLVSVAAPGMKKADFQISLENDQLIIEGSSSSAEEHTENPQFIHQEYNYTTFKRTISLNNKVVDDAKIQASYQDGILLLTIPKSEEAKIKPTRRIKIT